MSTEARRPAPAPQPEAPEETTTRLRPIPPQPAPTGPQPAPRQETPRQPSAGEDAPRPAAPRRTTPPKTDGPRPAPDERTPAPDGGVRADTAPRAAAPRPPHRPAPAVPPPPTAPPPPTTADTPAAPAPQAPQVRSPRAGAPRPPAQPATAPGDQPAPVPQARSSAQAPQTPPARSPLAPVPQARSTAPAPHPPAQPPHAPAPHPRAPHAAAPHPPAYWGVPPETSRETTVRLRPITEPKRTGRLVAAVVCLVLGLGLLAGAAAGTWLLQGTGDAGQRTAYTEAATLWHSTPVDTLFPRTVRGDGAGPGGADRAWTRVAVAPDAPCAEALQPQLAATLAPVGCLRVLRATYTDATSSSVTTVGLVFLETDATAMKALRTRFTTGGLDRSPDLIPPAHAAPGTVASRFGNAQRASWYVNVLTEAPVIVYGVAGFADGRAVIRPQPAPEAMAKGQTTAPAQAGLGHEARGIADRIEKGLRATVTRATQGPARKGNR